MSHFFAAASERCFRALSVHLDAALRLRLVATLAGIGDFGRRGLMLAFEGGDEHRRNNHRQRIEVDPVSAEDVAKPVKDV